MKSEKFLLSLFLLCTAQVLYAEVNDFDDDDGVTVEDEKFVSFFLSFKHKMRNVYNKMYLLLGKSTTTKRFRLQKPIPRAWKVSFG